MTQQEPNLDTVAIIDLAQANVPPVAGTAAWEREMGDLREDAASDRSTPPRAAIAEIVEAATLEG